MRVLKASENADKIMSLKLGIAIPGFSAAAEVDDALQACINLAAALAAYGHEVTVYVSDTDMKNNHFSSTCRNIIAPSGVRVVSPERLTGQQVIAGWFRRRSYEFFQWLKSRTPPFDCVIAPEWQGITYYALLARRQGLAFADTHFITSVSAPTQWRYTTRTAMPVSVDTLEVMFMERQVVRRADAAVINNSGLRHWLDRFGWALPGTTRVIPPLSNQVGEVWPRPPGCMAHTPPVFSAASPPSAQTTGPIRELVFAGPLDTAAGVELFCDAIQVLPEPLRTNVKCSFIGTIGEVGPLAGDWYVTRALRRTGCQYTIFAKLSPPRQLQYLQSAGRVAIFTAPPGALPQLLVNCVAAGIPILIPENCGLRDYLPAEEFGKCCFTPTAAGLSVKIQTVLKDGGARVSSQALVQHAAEDWKSLLHTLCSSEFPARDKTVNELAVGDNIRTTGDTNPLISVCLVHYNRPETLHQAIASLQAQTYKNFEVILVDDGSPSPEARTFLNSLEDEFAKCKWRIIRQENQYMWRARNNAAHHARGNYLAFMDDDNIARGHWLTRAMDVAQRTHADVVTSTMTLFHGSVPPNPETLYPMWVPLGAAASAGAFLNVFGDVHCLVKRRVFEELGGFEERYSGYQEDWEFFARAVLAGHKLELIPEPLLFYRISQNSVSRSSAQNWNANRACSIQPYVNAVGPALRDLILLMLENQRLYSAVTSKRASGRWNMIRQLNRRLRGRAADAPVVVQTTIDAQRAAGAVPARRRGPRV
jgi:GT2 family glycosyltransferase